MHPNTYVNKLLFSGTNDGKPTLQLWNIMSEQKIFTFDETLAKADSGFVSCMSQSPVVDVIVVGFEKGMIMLVNILYNDVLLTLDQSADGGPVKCVTFSTDTEMQVSLLASITESREGGQNIVLWDLNEKKISSTLKKPHSGKQISHI